MNNEAPRTQDVKNDVILSKLVSLEKTVDTLKENIKKLNIIIIGNGHKGLAETARDLGRLYDDMDRRMSAFDNRCLFRIQEQDQKDKDNLIKEKEELKNESQRKKDDKNKIINGILLALLIQAIFTILRDPSIISNLFH